MLNFAEHLDILNSKSSNDIAMKWSRFKTNSAVGIRMISNLFKVTFYE